MEVLFLLNLNKYSKCVSCQLERIRDERCVLSFFVGLQAEFNNPQSKIKQCIKHLMEKQKQKKTFLCRWSSYSQ